MIYYYKDEKYYKSFIASQRTAIAEFQELASQCKTEESRKVCDINIMDTYRNIIVASCSMEISLKKLLPDIQEFLNYARKQEKDLPISTKLEVLSLKYLCHIGISNGYSFISQLQALLQKSDAAVYRGFLDVLSASDAKVALSDFMNKKWYNLCEDFPWYDTQDKDCFAGYWSFLAAGIAKSKSIDVKNIKFIPRNLLA